MFNDFTTTEWSSFLNIIYNLSLVDGQMTNYELAMLSSLASVFGLSKADWKPIRKDLNDLLFEVNNIDKSKVEVMLRFMAQFSLFDGYIHEQELSFLLPFAESIGLGELEFQDLINNAIEQDALSTFDKIIIYALISKAIYIDDKVADQELDYLHQLKLKFNIPMIYESSILEENIQWILRMMKTYPKQKLLFVLDQVLGLMISDQEFHDLEVSFIVKVATIFNVEHELEKLLINQLGGRKI